MTDAEDTYRNDHRLNSRPLDVHRWSDHPEVKQLINVCLRPIHKTEQRRTITHEKNFVFHLRTHAKHSGLFGNPNR